MPRRDRHLLEDALEALALGLADAGAPWMVIGGIAVIAHGVRRFTTDIDAAVRGDAVSIDGLLGSLARRKIAPRIADAGEFAQENLVLLLRHEPSGVDLDVSLAWTAFEHDALRAAETLLVLHPNIDLARIRARIAELAALAEAPELLDAFERTAVRARGGASSTTPTPRRKRSRRH